MKRLRVILSVLAAVSLFSAGALGDDFGILTTTQTQRDFQKAAQDLKLMDFEQFQAKIIKDLKTDFDSKKFIKTLGPGVTGGGDSCEQKIAYSYAFLVELAKNGKIDLSAYKVFPNQMLEKMSRVEMRFGQDLSVNRPVEMINVPPADLIILDRKICQNSFEPLFYYTPLLLHEVLRLLGIEDGHDYAVSGSFIPKIQYEIRKTINKGRKFRIFSEGSWTGVAMAWGLRETDVDFEEIDLMDQEEQWKFFENNADKIENYIVDLKTMKILSVIRVGSEHFEEPGGPIIELTDSMGANHNDLKMLYDSRSEIGLVWGSLKWYGGVEMIFATKIDEVGHAQIVGSCGQSCEEDIILSAMKKKMTKQQLKDYESFATRTTEYELTKDKNGFPIWKVTATAENPKEDVTTYQGYMRLSFKDGKFAAVFGKMKKTDGY